MDEQLGPHDPHDAADLFALHYNFVNKLFEAGESSKPGSGVKNLMHFRDSISKVKIFSLFSGLGGAELCAQQAFLACKKKCEEIQIDPPTRPTCLVACDVDPGCQKVLASHSHPPEYIIDDMMRFVNPSCALFVVNFAT